MGKSRVSTAFSFETKEPINIDLWENEALSYLVTGQPKNKGLLRTRNRGFHIIILSNSPIRSVLVQELQDSPIFTNLKNISGEVGVRKLQVRSDRSFEYPIGCEVGSSAVVVSEKIVLRWLHQEGTNGPR